MNDERPLRFTDSYLTSTISTTSGLGSNYTTNTSGSSNTQQTTPSPRRKTSSTSFIEVAEIPEQEISEDNATQYFTPVTPNFSDYRLINQPQTSHYLNRMQDYGSDNAQRNIGYFGNCLNEIYFHEFCFNGKIVYSFQVRTIFHIVQKQI